MASNGAVLSVLTDVLKNLYLGTVHEQLNNEILVNQILQLDSKSVDLEGLQAVIALHTGRSSGIGSRQELDTLPVTGNQTYKKAVYDLKYHYGRIQVSGQALQKTKSNVGAFLRAYESELSGIKNDLALDQARQIYGDGTGVISSIPSGTTSATQTLASAEPITHGFLYPGMLVDVGTLANPVASGTGLTILDVNEAAGTVIFTASFTSTSGDKIFRAGNNAASSVTKEIDSGLQALVPSAGNTIGGIDATSVSIWDNLRDTGGGAISLSNLMINVNKVMNKGVTMSNLKALSTPGIARRLFETAEFKSNVRFVDTKTLGAGFESLSFSQGAGTVNLVTDRLAPWGKLFLVPTENFRRFSPGDWDFLARDGLAVKWVDSKDAFQSVLFMYSNLGTNRRNNSLVMSGLTDTGF